MIETIFEELKKVGAVSGSRQFSEQWLGMERNYLRCLRAKRRSPSAKVIVECAKRLQHVGKTMNASGTQSSKAVGQHLLILADRCLESLLQS